MAEPAMTDQSNVTVFGLCFQWSGISYDAYLVEGIKRAGQYPFSSLTARLFFTTSAMVFAYVCRTGYYVDAAFRRVIVFGGSLSGIIGSANNGSWRGPIRRPGGLFVSDEAYDRFCFSDALINRAASAPFPPPISLIT